jgi:phosphoglycolate phosphatase-like HAD superfamily hydrolase
MQVPFSDRFVNLSEIRTLMVAERAMSFDGYIFDIEGTLIDCVPQTLSSLHDTLREWGLSVPYESLQLYSGLDGDETLKIIAPSLAEEERKQLLAANGKRYEKIYLPRVKAFAGVRELFEAIKAGSGSIALATDCKGLSLKVYRSLLDVDNFIDHVACGEDVHRGKPDPGLVDLAIEKLDLPAGRCVMIGDTPYDGEAALAAGAASMALLSGGFSREALLEAGATHVWTQISELKSVFAGNRTAR